MPFFPQFSNLFVAPYVPLPAVTPYAWYKADVGVTESGGVVSQWDNQSGSAGNLVVPSGKTGPTYVASGINSLPTIQFSSNSMALQLTGDTTTIKSIVSVVRSASSLATYQCIVEAGGGGLYTVLSSPDLFGSYWANFITYDALSASTDYILSVRVDSAFDPNNGGDTYGYLNDAEYSQTGSGFQPRDHITVGNDSSFTQRLNGYISELILFDVALTQAQINSYISDMNTKYAIY